MPHRDTLLDSLAEFARAMTETYDLTDTLGRLGDALTEALEVTGVGISVADPEGSLRYASATNEIVAHIERVQEQAQLGPCYEAFRTHRPVLVDDIESRPDWAEFRAEAERLGLRSVAGVPVRIRREVLGAVNLYSCDDRRWNQDDVEVAVLFSDMAAGYLLHTALEHSRRLADQLQLALDSRIVIEQAKGVLATEWGISVDAAFEQLRSYVRGRGSTLRSVAEAVVNEGFRPPRPT